MQERPGATGSPERVVPQADESAVPVLAERHDDDTAVLALQVHISGDGAASASRARHLLRRVLTERSLSALVDSATLLVSELVTNALRYGGGPRELTVHLDQTGVVVSVSDTSPAPPLQRDQRAQWDQWDQWDCPDDLLPENGRGLLLVSALADDWGWVQEPVGKRVWFRLRAR